MLQAGLAEAPGRGRARSLQAEREVLGGRKSTACPDTENLPAEHAQRRTGRLLLKTLPREQARHRRQPMARQMGVSKLETTCQTEIQTRKPESIYTLGCKKERNHNTESLSSQTKLRRSGGA